MQPVSCDVPAFPRFEPPYTHASNFSWPRTAFQTQAVLSTEANGQLNALFVGVSRAITSNLHVDGAMETKLFSPDNSSSDSIVADYIVDTNVKRGI